MTPPTPDAPARQLAQAQTTEYSQWVAARDIYHGTALAYRKGDPVPASNVKAHGYDRTGDATATNDSAAPAATRKGSN